MIRQSLNDGKCFLHHERQALEGSDKTEKTQPFAGVQGNASNVFGKGAQKAEVTAENVEQLHAKIGQLTMKNDFLERGLERIREPRGKEW